MTSRAKTAIEESHEPAPVTGELLGMPGSATVEYAMGVTVNIGDYQSLRVDVRLSMPCYPSETEIERCYDQTRAWVEDRLNAEILKNEGARIVRRH